jgi:hypothetical protein
MLQPSPISISLSLSLSLSCCSHLEHRTSVERFVSLQFLKLRQSVGLLGRSDQPIARPLLKKDMTNTEYKHTDVHISSGIRTHDPSVRARETVRALDRPAKCDRRSFPHPFLIMIYTLPYFIRVCVTSSVDTVT